MIRTMSEDRKNLSKSTKRVSLLKTFTEVSSSQVTSALTAEVEAGNDRDQLFDNLPDYISPSDVVRILPIALSTVYDWVYRPAKYSVPEGLIIKFGRRVFIRTAELKKWLMSRGPNQGRES